MVGQRQQSSLSVCKIFNMETLLQSDIFFFVSLISIIIVAVLVIVVATYVIRILRDVKSVTKQVKGGAKKVEADAVPLLKNIMKIAGALFLVSLTRRMNLRGKKKELKGK